MTYYDANGRKILITHGDLYDQVVLYAKWLAWLGDIGYEFLIKVNRIYNKIKKIFGLPYWSLSQYVKGKVKQAVNFVTEFEIALAKSAAKDDYAAVICGHIHVPEIKQIEEITYMNCGDWVESCSALVEDDNGNFEIITWTK